VRAFAEKEREREREREREVAKKVCGYPRKCLSLKYFKFELRYYH
jgi:hypothetical protein